MHNDSPGPFTATQVVVCLGGPIDGEKLPVPIHCIDFEARDNPTLHYRYCPFATALFHKPCFIHQSITFDFYAP